MVSSNNKKRSALRRKIGLLRARKRTEKTKKSLAAEDLKYFKALGELGRPGIYSDQSVDSDARLREKVWWWLSSTQKVQDQKWLEYWFEHHSAGKVGTNNLSNREAWLEAALKKIPKGKKILDAGAGELQYKRFCGHLEYVSQDFGQYTGNDTVGLQIKDWDNSKLDIVSDITSIPVKDNSFDAIMCVEVFEHIPKPMDALKEFTRILKPGGVLILTAPFGALTHFAPYFFYTGYSRYFYETILKEFGFKINDLSMNGNYFECLAQEIRRLDEMAARYAPRAGKPTYFDDITKQVLLRRLDRLSKKEDGSGEIQVHGMNVLATKTKQKVSISRLSNTKTRNNG